MLMCFVFIGPFRSLAEVVTCVFECIIPGRQGKGTDVTFFDEDYLVRKVIAVRHSGGGPPAS